MTAATKPSSAPLPPLDEASLAAALLAQWPGAVVVLDAEAQVRWMNERARSWLRARSDRTEAFPFQELVLPWKIDRALLERVRHGHPQVLASADLVDVAGTLRPCSARLAPLALPEQPTGVLLLIEERAALTATEESESKRLRRRDFALAAAQVGFWEWDLEAGTASIDADWCALLGIDPCAGPDHVRRWLKNVHPDELPELQRRMNALRAGEAEQIEVEYRMLTRDFRWVWLMQRGRIVERAPDGHGLRVSGVCIDIDERKRGEVNLRESESRLATALWGARAALWHWHVPNNTLTLSPMWFAMTGYTKEEWESAAEPLVSRIHPEDVESFDRAIRAHLAGHTQSIEVEYRLRCASGEWKWVLARGRVVEWDLNGAPTIAIGVSLDVHAQKEAEIKLAKSELRLQTAVWGARMGLWEMDVPSGKARWFSDWCEQLDIDPCDREEHVATWDANIHPDDVADPQRKFAEHIAGKEGYYDAQYRIRTRGGEWKWIWERGRVVERDADGQALRMVGVCMDIDQGKGAEIAALKFQQRLQTAIESARGGMWEWDGAAGRVFADEVYRQMLGLEPGPGATNAAWAERVHPDDLPGVEAVAAGVRVGLSDVFECEYRLRHASGAWIWVLDRGRAIERDERGEASRVVGFVLDISRLKLAESALLASEQRFQLAAEAVRGMLYEIDLATRRAQRHGLERLLGYQLGELAASADAWLALLHPEDLPRVTQSLREARERERIVEQDYRVLHRDGHYVHVWDRSIVLRDAAGKPARVVGFTMDISDRVRDQEALRKSELFYRSVAALSPGYVFEVRLDDTGRSSQVIASEGFEQIHGGTPEEFERRGGWDAFVDFESISPDVRRERLVRGEPISGDARVRTLAGEWKWLFITAQPVRDPANGRVTGAIGSALDITERKRAEEALRTQARILETMGEGVVLVDARNQVRLTNPAFDAMFGFGAGELVGRTIEPYFRLTESLLGRGEDRPAGASTAGQPVEFDCTRRDGSRFVCACVVTPVPIGGERHWLAVLADVTERKRMEREILEIASREQQRIGSDLHDGLGQDLTGVALMLRSIAAQLRKEGSSVRADVEDLIGLVNSAIDATRNMARGLSPVSGSRGGLVPALGVLAERARERYGIAVRFAAPEEEALALDDASATHLYRIAQEALTNAIRHGRVSSVEIVLEIDTERVVLTVRDDGQGFDPRSANAGGIGLKIMQYRAQMLRGELIVRAAPGEGVTIVCACPHRAPPGDTAPRLRTVRAIN